MKFIGFTGGINAVHEARFPFDSYIAHDAAAVLVVDGMIVAAVEQERLDRIKHSNKRCAEAIRFCLDRAGLRPEEIDGFGYYGEENLVNSLMHSMYLNHASLKPIQSFRTFLSEKLSEDLDFTMDPAKLHFVEHHHCHAVSAYNLSGFDDALVITLDGFGNYHSGTVALGKQGKMERIKNYSMAQSLGFFYWEVIKSLGYSMFDEYKVMGLAPYGNPAAFRNTFEKNFELLPEGDYRLNREEIAFQLFYALGQARRKGEPFTQAHKDVAAGLQETLEKIGLHVVSHFQKQTGLRKLALAGGVIHNCSMNGQILYSGLFDEIFAQPASHDAGAAMGAALHLSHEYDRDAPHSYTLEHVFLGPALGEEDEIEKELRRWSELVDIEHMAQPDERVAELLADGKVVGWTQGRSEFGPRALGNRSIVADPRPAENKRIINDMIKKREGYRPFAPSVLEEEVDTYFETIDTQKHFPFMIFVLKVKPEHHATLGAITHVDGTARVQTVSRATNPKYWSLINAFRRRTGIGMVLNTSFNNHAEPIVDSVHDAVTCYLTTKLHYLVVGNWLVRKRNIGTEQLAGLVPSLPKWTRVNRSRRAQADGTWRPYYYLAHTLYLNMEHGVSEMAYHVMDMADGKQSIDALLPSGASEVDRAAVVTELEQLWGDRKITLSPL